MSNPLAEAIRANAIGDLSTVPIATLADLISAATEAIRTQLSAASGCLWMPPPAHYSTGNVFDTLEPTTGATRVAGALPGA